MESEKWSLFRVKSLDTKRNLLREIDAESNREPKITTLLEML